MENLRYFFLCLALAVIPFCSFAKKQGRDFVDSLLRELPKAKEDTSKVKLMGTISGECWAFDPEKGIGYAEEMLALAKKLGWKQGEGLAHYYFAVNYRYKSDYRRTNDELNLAMTIWQQLNNKKDLGRVYTMKSIVSIDQSDYAQALDYSFKSLKIFEDLHNKSRVASVLGNIGIIYEDQGDHAKAMDYDQKCLKAFEDLNEQDHIPIALSNIGLVYIEMKDYTNALVYQFRALEISQKMGQQNVTSKVLGYIGAAYKEARDYTKALYFLYDAKAIDEQLGNKAGVAEKLQNIGIVHLALVTDSAKKAHNPGWRQIHLDSAIICLSQAAAIHKEIGNIKDLSENYRDLTTARQLSGDYKAALEAHIQYTAYKDSFAGTERNKQLSELETKYETREKDRQIADQDKQIAYNRKINLSLVLSSAMFLALGIIIFLSARKTSKLNKLVTIQKTELEKLNSVKDRIFSVISHDLRTPVNSLISFTQLLENGDMPPEKLQKYSETLKSNLNQTAGLMENLLNWARTQMQGYNPVFEKFDVAETTRQTVELLGAEAAKKNIEISNRIEADTIVFADMNMTSLLIRNLLSNAIKYTPNGGTITLSANKSVQKVALKISDTGVGIPQMLVDDFNSSNTGQALGSTPGTNKEKGTGLGLMLCKAFAALMNGAITLQSKQGKGSTFTVELPA